MLPDTAISWQTPTTPDRGSVTNDPVPAAFIASVRRGPGRRTMTNEILDPHVTTAMVADCLDEVGYRDQVMDATMVPLRPGMRCQGHAATVRFAPTSDAGDEPYDRAIDLLSALPEGSVTVISTGGDDRTGYWGELFSAAALGRGSRGVVCDGPVRDSDQTAALGFPVFAPATRPIDFRDRMAIVGAGEPVTCAGVLVAPGDLIVADADGVVVVPAAVEDEVVSAATDRAHREKDVLTDLLAGASLRAVWETYRLL